MRSFWAMSQFFPHWHGFAADKSQLIDETNEKLMLNGQHVSKCAIW
jgi:hypothetical protein